MSSFLSSLSMPTHAVASTSNRFGRALRNSINNELIVARVDRKQQPLTRDDNHIPETKRAPRDAKGVSLRSMFVHSSFSQPLCPREVQNVKL